MSEQNLEKLLTTILSRLSVIEARLSAIEDHEQRLRDLEKNRYQNAWLISLVGAVVTSGIVLLVTKGLA